MKPIIFGLLFGTSLLGAIAFAANVRGPKEFTCDQLLRPLSEAVVAEMITVNEAEAIWQECLNQ